MRNWEDDEGTMHYFNIPNSYYTPNGGMRLLRSQHWSKEYRIQTVKTSNQSTQEDRVVLTWNNNKNAKMIIIDNKNNIDMIHMSPNTKGYTTYAETF